MFADQWEELLCGNQKCNRVNKTQQSQNDESRQPIRVSECEKFFEKVLVIHRSDIPATSQRSKSNLKSREIKAETDISIFFQDNLSGRIIERDPEMRKNRAAQLAVNVIVSSTTCRLRRGNSGAADPKPFIRTDDAPQ